MKRITSALALAVGIASFVFACSKKAPPAPAEPAPTAKAPEPEPKPAEPKPAEPPKVEPAAKPAEDPAMVATAITGEARVKKYLACWDLVNAKKFDELKACFAPDVMDDQVDSGMPAVNGWDAYKTARLDVYATAFPDFTGKAQYVFQVGDHTFGVILFGGTHGGVLKSAMGDIPATNKKTGQLIVHHVEWQKDAEVVKNQWFMTDTGTMLSQLGLSQEPARPVMEGGVAEPVIVIAKGDEAEAALVANYKREIEAFNKHDLATAFANLGDKFVWSEASAPADLTDRATLEGQMKGMIGAFSDLAMAPAWVGAAGPFVIAFGRFKGTNDGENAAMKMPKTGKAIDIGYYEVQQYEGGKISHNWVFYNEIAIATQLGLLGGGAPK